MTGGDFTTDEDVTVSLGAVGGALVDDDGSESVAYRMTGVDPDASFTSGTRSADGTFWTFTQAEIDAGLSFTPPEHEDGLFEMVMEVTASENGVDEVSTRARSTSR